MIQTKVEISWVIVAAATSDVRSAADEYEKNKRKKNKLENYIDKYFLVKMFYNFPKYIYYYVPVIHFIFENFHWISIFIQDPCTFLFLNTFILHVSFPYHFRLALFNVWSATVEKMFSKFCDVFYKYKCHTVFALPLSTPLILIFFLPNFSRLSSI